MAGAYFGDDAISPRSWDEMDEHLKWSTFTIGRQPLSLTEQSSLAQSSSSIGGSSTCSDPFRNKKVEMKDGYLIVSEYKDEDSACTSVMGNALDEWENVYQRHRDEIVDRYGFISTPLHVVKMFAHLFKEELHIEHFILKDPKEESKVVYRVDILIGSLRGAGQCSRKQMARQLAAIDIYEKIQLKRSDMGSPVSMPRCGLFPGWRIDTIVFTTLFHDVCTEKGLQLPTFQVIPPPKNKLGKFRVICRVGKIETRGENDHPWLAKKLAAKEMYEAVAGSEFPLCNSLMGADVIGFPKMKLLGFDPKVTNLKRKWMMDHRIKDTQVVLSPNEPDDGDMDDVEAEAQMMQSKKVKMAEMKETLKITINARGTAEDRIVTSVMVPATTANASSSSSSANRNPVGSPKLDIIKQEFGQKKELVYPEEAYDLNDDEDDDKLFIDVGDEDNYLYG